MMTGFVAGSDLDFSAHTGTLFSLQKPAHLTWKNPFVLPLEFGLWSLDAGIWMVSGHCFPAILCYFFLEDILPFLSLVLSLPTPPLFPAWDIEHSSMLPPFIVLSGWGWQAGVGRQGLLPPHTHLSHHAHCPTCSLPATWVLSSAAFYLLLYLGCLSRVCVYATFFSLFLFFSLFMLSSLSRWHFLCFSQDSVRHSSIYLFTTATTSPAKWHHLDRKSLTCLPLPTPTSLLLSLPFSPLLSGIWVL